MSGSARQGDMDTRLALRLVLILDWTSAGTHHVFLTHALDVELRGRLRHTAEHVVEIEFRRRGETDRIDAGDDERAQVRTRKPALLQLRDNPADRIVDAEDQASATPTFGQRPGQPL